MNKMNKRIIVAFFSTALVISLCEAAGLHWSPWVFASAAITALMLLIARVNMVPTTPAASIAIIALLYWGLSSLSNLIEAAYYHVITTHEALRDAPGAAIFAIIAACVLQWLVPKPAASGAPRLVALKSGQWWRIPLLCLGFFVTYFIAGVLVLPFVKAFYAGKPLPNLLQLFLLQLGRGLLDIACFYPWLLRAAGTRTRIALISSGIFVILCSWGPLLLPNAYLPGYIRFAHSLEMGGSGIAFGFLAAWLLLKRAEAEPAPNSATTANPHSTRQKSPDFTAPDFASRKPT